MNDFTASRRGFLLGSMGPLTARLTHAQAAPLTAGQVIGRIKARAGIPWRTQTVDNIIADVWSDPQGEFLAAVASEPVFKLFGKQGIGTTQMPAAGQPIFHTLGYVIEPGDEAT